MSNICEPNCPCCTPNAETVECEECNGYGATFFNKEWDTVTVEEYELLPEDERSKEKCSCCDGAGEIYY